MKEPFMHITHHKDGTYTSYINILRHGRISLDDLIDKIDNVLDKFKESESNETKSTIT